MQVMKVKVTKLRNYRLEKSLKVSTWSWDFYKHNSFKIPFRHVNDAWKIQKINSMILKNSNIIDKKIAIGFNIQLKKPWLQQITILNSKRKQYQQIITLYVLDNIPWFRGRL